MSGNTNTCYKCDICGEEFEELKNLLFHLNFCKTIELNLLKEIKP